MRLFCIFCVSERKENSEDDLVIYDGHSLCLTHVPDYIKKRKQEEARVKMALLKRTLKLDDKDLEDMVF